MLSPRRTTPPISPRRIRPRNCGVGEAPSMWTSRCCPTSCDSVVVRAACGAAEAQTPSTQPAAATKMHAARSSPDENMPQVKQAAAFDLTGTVALVTGSTRGIGLALARGLGQAGARVIVHGRESQRAEAVATSLEDAGISAGSVAFELREEEEIRQGIERVQAEHGGIDVLVNNAGVI